MRRQRDQNGFTILEILLVLVIIGLLGALVFSTYAGIRRNQRNQERHRDVQDIYQQLEAYDVENTKYPTLADVNNPTWRTANMKTLDKQSLRDPSSKSYDLAASPGKYVYSYQVVAADGTPCNNADKPCAHYTLTATLEGNGSGTVVKSSLN